MSWRRIAWIAPGLMIGLAGCGSADKPAGEPTAGGQPAAEVSVEKDDADAAAAFSEIKAAGLYRETAQAFAVLLPVQSVGVMGDARTYENAVAIRCVDTDDFMTADWTRLPYDLLANISTRIINEVPGVNRVTYDISTKPPATIEWE